MNHAVASPLTNQVGATGRGGPLGWRQSGKHHHRSSLKVLGKKERKKKKRRKRQATPKERKKNNHKQTAFEMQELPRLALSRKYSASTSFRDRGCSKACYLSTNCNTNVGYNAPIIETPQIRSFGIETNKHFMNGIKNLLMFVTKDASINKSTIHCSGLYNSLNLYAKQD
ncbi:hypothetical protein KCU92_g172, partial [Aureobasidium melanogenum]